MDEECTHAREQWRMADNKEQQVRHMLARAMAKIAELKEERNEVLLSASLLHQEGFSSHPSSFEAEEDFKYDSPAISPEYYGESHSGPPTMKRPGGRDSPSRGLKYFRAHSPRLSRSGDDADGGSDLRSASAGSKESSTPKKKGSKPSRVLAELVPLFAGGRASLRRRSSKHARQMTTPSSVDDSSVPPTPIKSPFSQEVGSPSTPVRNLVNYFDEPVDGILSKRSSFGGDMFDSSSQGATSRQSGNFEEISREMEKLRNECQQKEELCHEMRQRLGKSLKETASLRDDYNELLAECHNAMAQIRNLKSKVCSPFVRVSSCAL